MKETTKLFSTLHGLLGLLVAITSPCPPTYSQWIQQQSPIGQVFEKVRFFDASTGWITDDRTRLYKTSDGGVTWTVKDSIIGGYQTIGISSRDTILYSAYLGIPPYSSGIRFTSNGGDTWQTADTLPFPYYDILFITPSVGFAVGGKPDTSFLQFAPIIRRTSNAGRSWETVFLGGYGDQVRGVSFADTSHGWAITHSGTVYHSTNGGYSWAPQASLVPPMRDIQFTSPDIGWAVGGIAGTARVARTTDGGTHWSDTTFGGPSLLELHMLDSMTGWVVGPNAPYILNTTDGGVSWQRQQMIQSTGGGCYSIVMINRNLGWATGNYYVYKTTNGGTVYVDRHGVTPPDFSLHQNYPNPFNSITRIPFSVASSSVVTITVINILGQHITTLTSSKYHSGTYWATWDASNMPSGIYLCRMVADDFVSIKAMLLLR